MKAIKNINNNITICKDQKGREVIVFGKGVGFIKPPFDVPLEKIERTFYNVCDIDYSLLADVPSDILKVTVKIVDHMNDLFNNAYQDSVILSLADHINFAIERVDKNCIIDLTIKEDLIQLYPKEYNESLKAVKLINETIGCNLPESEAIFLTLHFINDRTTISDNEKIKINHKQEIINEVIKIIEDEYQIIISKDSFNYSRFVTHLDYLINRALEGKQINSNNLSLYNVLKGNVNKVNICEEKITKLFKEKLNINLNQEERLYLILHINRLCSRE